MVRGEPITKESLQNVNIILVLKAIDNNDFCGKIKFVESNYINLRREE